MNSKTRSKGWEYLLFFQVWADEIDSRSSNAETNLTGKVFRTPAEKLEWLEGMLREFSRMIEELDRLTKVSAPESFGPPGQPGDVEKIISVSKTLAEVYEKMLRWEQDIKRSDFHASQAKLSAAMQRMASPVVQRVYKFPHEGLQKVEDALSRLSQTGQPVQMELTLNVEVDWDKCLSLLKAAKSRL